MQITLLNIVFYLSVIHIKNVNALFCYIIETIYLRCLLLNEKWHLKYKLYVVLLLTCLHSYVFVGCLGVCSYMIGKSVYKTYCFKRLLDLSKFISKDSMSRLG